MRVIAKGRAEGKTFDLVTAASLTGAQIVCLNSDFAREVERSASIRGLEIVKPISLAESKHARMNYDFWQRPLYFDNADLLLRDKTGLSFDLVTMTSI